MQPKYAIVYNLDSSNDENMVIIKNNWNNLKSGLTFEEYEL